MVAGRAPETCVSPPAAEAEEAAPPSAAPPAVLRSSVALRLPRELRVRVIVEVTAVKAPCRELKEAPQRWKWPRPRLASCWRN
mmetsp:Transcript_9516/g.26762  ORF Transcript_9516/g.26762 Transcript_9516/m.26762 type:complete len:83 (+) Transcript_9516:120-368(+)